MAFRIAKPVFVPVITCMMALPGWAGWHEFCQRTALDWKRANAWPQPFVEADRLATCAPFVLMAENGWAQQSTLTSFHFDPVSNQLTEAGRLKIQSILYQHPAPFRTVYVVRAVQDEQTQTRLEAVKETVTHLAGLDAPSVQLTTIEPRGMPAEEVQAISARLRETLPDPRLPPSTGVGPGASQ